MFRGLIFGAKASEFTSMSKKWVLENQVEKVSVMGFCSCSEGVVRRAF